eukprot:727857-Alexandrium_andersonii.AAC.1
MFPGNCCSSNFPEVPPARPPVRFISRFGICAKNSAERTPPELQKPMLRPFLGPRSSSVERLKPCCAFRRYLNTKLLKCALA